MADIGRPAVEAAMENELRLLDPEVRSCVQELGSLLHPEYIEFGRSGRRWDRAAIIAALTAEDTRAVRPITASRMTAVQLAPDLVHLTFDSDNNGLLAHRSSLWRQTEDGWLLYFHQATPFTGPTVGEGAQDV
ncbi:nuclear transport factor 2 family protein [Streptomyces sp. NBC_01431]|uniref:nuclear transport factor 2 family protein n=1 Tax=Streptomyces sp. NBC_01431 TaxID=2903863 RepID=UPI002E35550F|nr:nuclear transport factor 2 family protein [Streptomyces sp. NBC_01431]